MREETKFKYLFWFCAFVFVVSFSAMMFLLVYDIPDKNREMASNTQGFLQGSLIMSAIGFLLTGNIFNGAPKKKAAEGMPGTLDLNLTATTSAVENTDTEPLKEE